MFEFPEHFRPGLGTENIGPFLRSFVQMVRPKRLLEVGAGYTTPFLVDALTKNETVIDDGNLDLSYFENYVYDPKLVIIDDMSLGDLDELTHLKTLFNTKYIELVSGKFEGMASKLKRKFGEFDFVWFDCGGADEYEKFMEEYWDICNGYVFFHFTFTKGVPNANFNVLFPRLSNVEGLINIIEPHKFRQGSVTMIKKSALRA